MKFITNIKISRESNFMDRNTAITHLYLCEVWLQKSWGFGSENHEFWLWKLRVLALETLLCGVICMKALLWRTCIGEGIRSVSLLSQCNSIAGVIAFSNLLHNDVVLESHQFSSNFRNSPKFSLIFELLNTPLRKCEGWWLLYCSKCRVYFFLHIMGDRERGDWGVTSA